MNWFLLALKNTFNFKDRARRREYGWFLLISTLINLSLEFFITVATTLHLEGFTILLSIIIIVIGIWFAIAGISITTRRLHDLNHSGWWQLAPLGAIILALLIGFVSLDIAVFLVILVVALYLGLGLYLLFKDGQPYNNRYGVSPKFPALDKVNHF